MPAGDITAMIAAAQEGDEAAAEVIWDAYYHRLLAYARKRLISMPRRSVDEEDVVLSAMHSFFDGAKQDRFRPQDRDELWKLLATITVRKATGELRKHYAQKRGGGNVRGESVFARNADTSEDFGIDQVMDDAQLPAMVDRLTETCEERMQQLNDESLKTIARMRLEGYGNEEIAEKVGCSLATVKRKLARIRELWTEAAPR